MSGNFSRIIMVNQVVYDIVLIQIVLGVKEGKGFEQILQRTSIVATLNAHSLETDVVEPCSNPQYATDLIWEMDKSILRKMRSGQTPLKVECFIVKDNASREKVGYLILSLRSAQVIPKSLEISAKANWCKLLGLKGDFKINKPELLLTLTIEDRCPTTSNVCTETHDEIDSHRNPGGDFGKCVHQPINTYRQENKYPPNSRIFKNQPHTVITSQTADTVFCQCNQQNCLKSVEVYHYYCLSILLNAITLQSSKTQIQNIEFWFFHPKDGTTPVTYPKTTISTDERTRLQNIDCKLYFISTADEIKHLVVSHPPKISIHDADEYDKPCISQCVPNMKQLFLQNECQCQFEIPLYDMKQNKIGDLDIMLYLEDHGPYNKIKKKSCDDDLGPPILDDNLAYKIVDELETWKERQKQIFIAEINILQDKNANLEAKIEKLSRENETLKMTVNTQAEELDIYQKGSLTQDQTASLLQELKTLEEKLHSAQNSKSFFKEQWAKAVREIHRMKIEHQQAIELQIKNSKEELQNINLEEILCADSNALTNDKMLLNQIQREIDVIKPKPELIQTDNYCQVFAPTTGVSSRISHGSNKVLSKSSEYDDRLQALIEERDSLLKTGSYTIDDTVILRLNTEIRSLMIK
ncbi:hypothetical protein KM043_005854 [Ampulex compressa]|nr:hypothetical protein KM043_005854 [Ampulex compressa]